MAKVMVYEGTPMGFRQVGERVVKKDNKGEYVRVRGKREGFDWVSVSKKVVHIG